MIGHLLKARFTSWRHAARFAEDHGYLRFLLHAVSLAVQMQVSSSQPLTSQVGVYQHPRKALQDPSVSACTKYRPTTSVILCREIFPLTNFNQPLHSLTTTNAGSTSLENHRAKYWPEVTHLNATQANGAGLCPLRAQTKLPVASWLHDTLMSQQLHVFTSALPAPGNSERHSNSKEWLVGGPSSSSACARKGVRKESCRPCGCCCLQHDIRRAATFAIMPHWSNCCCYEHVECKTM